MEEEFVSKAEYDRVVEELSKERSLTKMMDERFAMFTQYINQGLRIIGLDYTIKFVNDKLLSMVGMTREEVIGRKCWEIFPSASCHTDSCAVSRVLNGENFFTIDQNRINSNGSIIHCEITAFRFVNFESKLSGIIELFSDVTEKQKLENQLTEMKNADLLLEQLKTSEYDAYDSFISLFSIVNNTGEALVIVKPDDYSILFSNNTFSNIIGINFDQLIKINFLDLIANRFKTDAINVFNVILNNDDIKPLDIALTSHIAFEIPVRIRMHRINYLGNESVLIRLHEINRDKSSNTETADFTNKYNFLFMNSPIPTSELNFSQRKAYIEELKAQGIDDIPSYLVSNPDLYRRLLSGYVQVANNNAILKLHDADSVDEIKSYSTSSQPIDRIKTNPMHQKEYISQILSVIDGVNPPPIQTTLVTLKGNVKHIISYFFVHPDDTNREHVIWSAIDVTDAVNSENRVKMYMEQLEEIVRNRTRELSDALYRVEQNSQRQTKFIQHIVHDLKTPLLPMMSSSEMLTQNIESPQLKRIANNVYRGTIRMKNSINDLVDVMRGEEGVLRLDVKPTDLTDILNETIDFYLFEACKNGQNLSIEITNQLPIVEIDGNRIKQVVMNLIENALRFTETNGEIILKAFSDDNNIYVVVKDNGIGLRDVNPEKLFLPYYSTEFGTGTASGLGLGLPLAKMVMELHGGTITADNIEPHGAVFKLSIPTNNN